MHLARCYRFGTGTERDESVVLYWCRKAATNGLPEGQATLGRMYRTGAAGLTKDMHEAVRWLTVGAENGDVQAQYELGMLYIHGREIAKDAVEATKWFARAARQGQAGAQNAFGYSLGNGIGVQPDLVESYKWLSLALAQKDPQAQVNFPVIEAKLSPAQIADGKQRARDFVPKLEIPQTQRATTLETFLESHN